MAISYNTSQLQNKKSPLKTVLSVVALVGIVGASYFAGVYTQPVLASQASKKVSKPCTAFTSQVFSGDLDAAYESTAADLKAAQSLDEFKESLTALKSNSAKIGQLIPAVAKDNASLARCEVLVSGLPADEEGNEDALVTLTLAEENGSWKIVTITVQ